MNILIRTVRIYGFRGLKNFEIDLEPTTVLTGMNNAGKTSFLKALQIVLGSRQFLTPNDFYISDNDKSNKITIDIEIIPIDEKGKQIPLFDEDWETLFTDNKTIVDLSGNQLVPLRTTVNYDFLKSTFKTKQFIQREWVMFKDDTEQYWHQTDNGKEMTFHYDEIPYFYMDAQRDILEDLRIKNSYLGKMVSNIEYSEDDIKEIEKKIKELNEQTVNSSDVLEKIETTLKELDSTIDNSDNKVNITPFPKKIRDLNKGVTIQYSDFSMEYHGMGTRSWSSFLTLKSFISLFEGKSTKNKMPFFPIMAIEEPEAHLHPNAQKKLFNQISSINGQKIISTHSPFLVASSSLGEIRNFVRGADNVGVGKVKLSDFEAEDIRKINRQVINSRGELLFSKAIVLFEGETEEQVLPILAEYHFKTPPFDIGIDFIGVGGAGNYLPFLRIAHKFKIPWFIFSDGEERIIKKVKKDIKTLYGIDSFVLNDYSNVIILPNESNFERYLVENDYIDEIRQALAKLHGENYLEKEIQRKNGISKGKTKTDSICNECKQYIYKDKDYTGDDGFKEAIYDCITLQKTKFSSVLADVIIKNEREIPPKIEELFNQIKLRLTNENV